jgi:hypothetical protein
MATAGQCAGMAVRGRPCRRALEPILRSGRIGESVGGYAEALDEIADAPTIAPTRGRAVQWHVMGVGVYPMRSKHVLEGRVRKSASVDASGLPLRSRLRRERGR